MPVRIPLDDPRQDVATIRQACARFGLTRSHLERLINTGTIPVYMLGLNRMRRVRFSDIDRYVDSTRVPAEPTRSD